MLTDETITMPRVSLIFCVVGISQWKDRIILGNVTLTRPNIRTTRSKEISTPDKVKLILANVSTTQLDVTIPLARVRHTFTNVTVTLARVSLTFRKETLTIRLCNAYSN